MKRREFISKTAMTMPMLSMFPSGLASLNIDKKLGQIEKRSLGKTGIKLSAIGFGGIVVMNATSEEAASRVKEAIDFGVNYFDVAPSYGNAEEMLGPALEQYRKKVYLACKTTERSKDGSRKELEESLKKLRTDHFDIYQLHAVTTLQEVDDIFAKDGALNTFLKAREEGIVKNIGFSAHSVEAATELMNRYEFDTILFPFNYTCWYKGNFGPQVMEMAKQKGMGILALKSMAFRPWQEGAVHHTEKVWYEPLTEKEKARKGLRFTLSHPVTAAIPPGNEKLFSMALRLAAEFEPMSPEEILEMKEKAMDNKPIFSYPMG